MDRLGRMENNFRKLARSARGANYSQVLPSEEWVDLPLENSWVAAGGGSFTDPQYRRTFDNYVEIRGITTGGTTGVHITIATLPAEYRPILSRTFLVHSSDGATGLDVLSSGIIRVATIATNSYLSLEVTFSID